MLSKMMELLRNHGPKPARTAIWLTPPDPWNLEEKEATDHIIALIFGAFTSDNSL